MRFVFKQLYNNIIISEEMKALQNSSSKVILKCVISVQMSDTFEYYSNCNIHYANELIGNINSSIHKIKAIGYYSDERMKCNFIQIITIKKNQTDGWYL